MSRPADRTRQALVTAATAVFAEKGFEAGSVREIAQRAKANPAAISYHFGGKEDLYREVLRAAFRAFEAQAQLTEAEIDALNRREALRRYLAWQLQPLVKRDQFSRIVRLFAWENVSPTPVLRALVAAEPLPVLALAGQLVRRYRPRAEPEELALLTFWLVNQTGPFVRDAAFLVEEPFRLTLDQAFVDRLGGLLLDLVDGALAAGGGVSD
ncbi:MAG TPA: CerR family C-terminal domain-containing protein [Beijerinckiaceae bacterium]